MPAVLNHEPLATHSVEWQAIHREVRATYGSATEYECDDCGKPAREWAWQHGTDPKDVANYYPMCKSCHKQYDQTEEWQDNINAALPRGEQVAQSMLKEHEVLEIRARYSAGGISQQKLADEFHVSVMTINHIVNRKTWGWL